jgi:hypothetical protein
MNTENFLLFPSSSIVSRVVNPGFLKLQTSGVAAQDKGTSLLTKEAW